MTSRSLDRARAHLAIALSAAFILSLIVSDSASAQEATPSDIEVEGAVVGATGDQRTIRLTITNLGPGVADVRCEDPTCDPPEGSPAKGIEGSLQEGDGTSSGRVEVISRPPTGCREAPGIFTTVYCTVGDVLPAGESRTLDFVVRVFPGTTRVAYGSGIGDHPSEQFNDPNHSNQSGYIDLAAPEPCRLTATNPQKLTNALKVQVRGGAKGCFAKVISIKYKVGNRVFYYRGKKPQRRVAAGEVWRLFYPIKGTFKAIVARALRANKTVLGKVVADLDGQSNEIVVRVR